MSTPRYYVQSEQVRGERRFYWVADSTRKESWSHYPGMIEGTGTWNRTTAQKRCEKLERERRPR